jgi:hypothetical protein
MTIVLGWEIYGNWAWGIVPGQEASLIAAWRHVHSVLTSNGVHCTFGIDAGGVGHPPLADSWPGNDVCDGVGWHNYNGIHRADLYPNNNFQAIWDNELSVGHDELYAFARANGKFAFHSEGGFINIPDSTSQAWTYHALDTSLYHPYIHDKMKANADVCAFWCDFMQNQSSNNITTEYNQHAYSVTGGSLAGQTQTYYHNTSTHGPWVLDPGTAYPLSNNYKDIMIPGTVQLPDPPVTPPAVATHIKQRRKSRLIQRL